MRPNPAILDTFSVDEPAFRLVGRQGTAWRAGQLALEPLDARTAVIDLSLYWRPINTAGACL
ncbi:hypothetical protein [Rathayibacter soli]|uniref:hypothetical protein n=1 Tax=Rathayibacter soli TaxID=3144168 RepID=UPI0027E5BC37|nr:hypothetical protein [Glaciibacter superstes]